MTDIIIPLTVMNASDDGEWTRVIWQASIDGQEAFIDSGFGPRLRDAFLNKVGVNNRQISTLEGKVFHGRVYRDDQGRLKVSPESIFTKGKGASSASLTQQPFAGLADRVVLPDPMEELAKTVRQSAQAPVVVPAVIPAVLPTSGQNLSGLKGGDTKSLKAFVKACQHLLDRDGLESRLDNANIAEKVAELQLLVLKELTNRK